MIAAVSRKQGSSSVADKPATEFKRTAASARLARRGGHRPGQAPRGLMAEPERAGTDVI